MLWLVYIGSIAMALLYEDSGWLIAFALLEVADAIRKKGGVE